MGERGGKSGRTCIKPKKGKSGQVCQGEQGARVVGRGRSRSEPAMNVGGKFLHTDRGTDAKRGG